MQSPNAREERGEVCDDSLVIYTKDEYISLSLDYYFPQPRKDTPTKPLNSNGEGSSAAPGKRPNGDANGLPVDVSVRPIQALRKTKFTFCCISSFLP